MSTSDRRRRGEGGVILLLTLFVVALLCVIVLEFSYSTRVDYHIASRQRDELLALNIARAGVEETIARLREDRLEEIEEKEKEEEKSSGNGGKGDTGEEKGKEESGKAKEKGGKEKQGQAGPRDIAFPDHYGEEWAQERILEPFGPGFLSLKVIDESGKININWLVKEEKEATAGGKKKEEEKKAGEEAKAGEGEEEAGQGEKTRPIRQWGQTDVDRTGEETGEGGGGKEGETEEEPPVRYVVDRKVEKDIMRLIEGLDVRGVDAEEVTAAIVDWMDSDDEGDYEADEYARAGKNESPPKNAPLDLPSELLMVEGVSGDLYFGPKRPETIDLEEKRRPGGARRRRSAGLRDCVTTFSTAKVNVNTAPPEVLSALLEEENEDLVKEITRYTKRDYFKDLSQFEEEIGEHIPASFMAKIGVGSDAFQIIAEGRVNDARKRIRAVVRRDDEGNVRVLFWRVE